MKNPPSNKNKSSRLALAWAFLRLGAVAFGGLGATLALIEREWVERRRALTKEEVLEALTYTKLLPGSTVLQVVSYLGYKLGGWSGSAMATAAFILPSMVVMILLAVVYQSAATLPGLGPALKGLSSAVVGILLATTYRLVGPTLKEPLTLVLAAAAFIAGHYLGVNAALLVVGAGLLGVLFFSETSAPTGSRAR